MRITASVLAIVLNGCTNSIDRLWIEKDEKSGFRFYSDSENLGIYEYDTTAIAKQE